MESTMARLPLPFCLHSSCRHARLPLQPIPDTLCLGRRASRMHRVRRWIWMLVDTVQIGLDVGGSRMGADETASSCRLFGESLGGKARGDVRCIGDGSIAIWASGKSRLSIIRGMCRRILFGCIMGLARGGRRVEFVGSATRQSVCGEVVA